MVKIKPPFSTGQHCLATLKLDGEVVQKPVVILKAYELYKDSGVFNYWVEDEDGNKVMVGEDQLRAVNDSK